jgi:hypothetical protein
MKKNLVCQLNFGHILLGVPAMFVVGRELCLADGKPAVQLYSIEAPRP